MPPDLVYTYLQEIGRYPLLTPEEEVFYANLVQSMVEIERQRNAIALQLQRKPTNHELAILINKTEEEISRIFHRGQKAKNHIATANLRLVVMIAKRYQNRGLEFLDLIQEGSIGLFKSIEKFDPTKGYKFSTYAYWWIRQGITRAISDKSRSIALPVHLNEKLNKIKIVQRKLFQSLGRSPTIAEVAVVVNLSEEKVAECLKYYRRPASLNLCIGKDQDNELGEFIEADQISLDDKVDQDLLCDHTNNLLSCLTPMQQKVMSLRYGINADRELTLEQVAEQLNLSRERIRQIQNQAIRILRGKCRDAKYSF